MRPGDSLWGGLVQSTHGDPSTCLGGPAPCWGGRAVPQVTATKGRSRPWQPVPTVDARGRLGEERPPARRWGPRFCLEGSACSYGASPATVKPTLPRGEVTTVMATAFRCLLSPSGLPAASCQTAERQRSRKAGRPRRHGVQVFGVSGKASNETPQRAEVTPGGSFLRGSGRTRAQAPWGLVFSLVVRGYARLDGWGALTSPLYCSFPFQPRLPSGIVLPRGRDY